MISSDYCLISSQNVVEWLVRGHDQQQFMNYKQNVWNRVERVSSSAVRVDDERKLLELWKQEEVDEDYQAVVLRFLDGLNSKAEQHRHIQNELKRTYQRDSHYFRIDKLMQQRQKTMTKLEREVQALDRFKRERGQPNLEPICMVIDHLRKVHLLIAEEIHEMFNTYGHPRTTRVGFTYIQLFGEFDEDVQFLKDSLLKFYMPFSHGFDPLFLELSQKLRKCYTNESLVYDQNVEELINLNASYLYRLLRAQQRMLDAISVADHKDEEPSSAYIKKDRHQTNGRNILDSIAQAQPLVKSTDLTERFEQSRLIRQDSRRFSTPKNLENQSHYSYPIYPHCGVYTTTTSYPRPISPIRVKGTAEIGVQKGGPKLQIIRQNITIPKEMERLVTQKAQYAGSFKPSPQHSPNHAEEIEYNPRITPRKIKKSQTIEQEQASKPLRFYRKIQKQEQQSPPTPPTPPLSKYTQKRAHTEGNTIMRKTPKETRLRQFLPKVNASRAKNIDNKADCLCRQRYKDKHCEHHQQQEISEQELEKRRKIVIRDIQAKYKAMAQREMRHQLSKLGDVTYHRLRNQQHNRQSKAIKTVQNS